MWKVLLKYVRNIIYITFDMKSIVLNVLDHIESTMA